MNVPVRSELLKLSSLRLTWLLSAGAVLLAALIGAVGGHAFRDESVRAVDLVTSPAQAVFFVAIVVAVVASAREFQHRTIRTTLLAVPQRVPVLVAKAAAAGAFGAVVVAVTTAVAVSAATITRAALGASPAVWGGDAVGAALGAVALGAVWAVAATSIGVLTRSTAVALVAVLLWRFVGESIVPVVARQPELSRWTPSGAGDALIGLGGDRLSAPVAAGVLLAYLVVLLGAAALLFLRRDPA